MKKTIYPLLIICAFLASTIEVQAQKFGYINSVQLLSELPEIKAADAQLQTFQTGLVEKGQGMMKSLEDNYQKYMAEAQSGALSQVQQQQKEGELAKQQQEIQSYEYEVQNQIGAKREELYAPILEKVRLIIEDIGKQEGYTMIFDSSAGGLLSADDGDDILAIVKTKLGI